MSGETEEQVSGWTVDTLRAHVERRLSDISDSFDQQLEDMRSMLQERYATQTKAVDAAFLAQQTAMQTALSAAEKAVETALLSAEKAVTKAELAADKRFESVNEFRSQLADQAATLISRAEADARITALSEKLDEGHSRTSLRSTELAERFREEYRQVTERIIALEQRLTSRLDVASGEQLGNSKFKAQTAQGTTIVIAGLGVLVSVLAIVVVVVLAT